jgi:hypothetical protein
MLVTVIHCSQCGAIAIVSKAKIRIPWLIEGITIDKSSKDIHPTCSPVPYAVDLWLCENVTGLAARNSSTCSRFGFGTEDHFASIRTFSPRLTRRQRPRTETRIPSHSQMIRRGLTGIANGEHRSHCFSGNNVLNTLRWWLCVHIGAELTLLRILGDFSLSGRGGGGAISRVGGPARLLNASYGANQDDRSYDRINETAYSSNAAPLTYLLIMLGLFCVCSLLIVRVGLECSGNSFYLFSGWVIAVASASALIWLWFRHLKRLSRKFLSLNWRRPSRVLPRPQRERHRHVCFWHSKRGGPTLARSCSGCRGFTPAERSTWAGAPTSCHSTPRRQRATMRIARACGALMGRLPRRQIDPRAARAAADRPARRN